MVTAPQCILVLGASRQTLSVLRSLGKQHQRLILGCTDRRSHVTRSKYATRIWNHVELNDTNADCFFTELNTLHREQLELNMIFPVADREILFLTKYRDRLPKGMALVSAAADVVRACRQKNEMFQMVERLGIPLAPYERVADGSESVMVAANSIGYPCIIKPENESTLVFGKKAFIALNKESLQTCLAEHVDASFSGEPKIVQKYCVGGRRNIYFFAHQGEVLAAVEIAIDRTDQWDGTGHAVEGHTVAPDQQWLAWLADLVRAMNYQGAGCLQYLIDSRTGESTFLEINARLGANFVSAMDCGLDLPLWWVDQCCRDAHFTHDSGDQTFNYPTGRRYTWLYGDLRGLKQSIARKQVSPSESIRWIGRIVAANLRSRTHITFRWNDPLPTLYLFAKTVASPLRRRTRAKQ